MGRQQYWQDFEAGQKKWTPIKWWWQRTTRGFDDREIWDLRRSIRDFVAPRLEYFVDWQIEHGFHYPPNLDPAAWTAALKKMRSSINELEGLQGDVIQGGAVDDGLTLFGKYLWDLTDLR
jgi:hypothetical protein